MRLMHVHRLSFPQAPRSIVLAGLMVIVVGGCATAPPPTEQLASAKAAVDSAAVDGAPAYAPTETRLATDKLAAAQKAAATKDYVLARQLAEESQLDAQLSVRKMQTAKSSKAADEARKAATTGGTQ